MIGDSITDCGRSHLVEIGVEDSLGDGYVSMINGLLMAAYPEYHIKIINKGINGNTIRDLEQRWDRDVLDLKPDWLSIMIGINDVWQHFDPWTGVYSLISIEEYTETLERLVNKTLPSLKGLVLMTPYFLHPDKNNSMRALMDDFGYVVASLAEKYHALLVDTQLAFDEVMENVDPSQLAEDRVHVNTPGHMVLARAFLQAVGYPL